MQGAAAGRLVRQLPLKRAICTASRRQCVRLSLRSGLSTERSGTAAGVGLGESGLTVVVLTLVAGCHPQT